MAYSLAAKDVYDDDGTLGCEIMDDPRKNPMSEMAYVDPGSADWEARGMLPHSQPTQMQFGYPVVKDTAPKKLFWNGGARALPEVMNPYGILLVCNRFRRHVEQFEADTHQFIPVKVYNDRNAIEAIEHRYWFNICTRLDSVNFEHTTYTHVVSHEGTWRWSTMERVDGGYKPRKGAALFLSTAKIGKHHVWVDPTLSRGYALCSTAFGDAVIAANFAGLLVHYQVEA